MFQFRNTDPDYLAEQFPLGIADRIANPNSQGEGHAVEILTEMESARPILRDVSSKSSVFIIHQGILTALEQVAEMLDVPANVMEEYRQLWLAQDALLDSLLAQQYLEKAIFLGHKVKSPLLRVYLQQVACHYAAIATSFTSIGHVPVIGEYKGA